MYPCVQGGYEARESKPEHPNQSKKYEKIKPEKTEDSPLCPFHGVRDGTTFSGS